MKDDHRPHEEAANLTPWHSLSQDEVADRLKSPVAGLTATEAEYRLTVYGPNAFAGQTRRHPLVRLLLQFHNLLLYLMTAAGVITALLGEWVDAGVLWAAVLVNVLIGFIQEGKAEDALSAIRQMLPPQAVTVREGARQVMDARRLVPGDRVMIQSGDRVPADMRLVYTRDLRIDEASLTGESLAVGKQVDATESDASLGDRHCMAYSGTLVINGQGLGIVTATGLRSEIGQITRMIATVQDASTPLLRKLNRFSFWLAIVILGIGMLTFAVGVWARGYAVSEMFRMVVALIASAIPEGLPTIMTVILALGVQRMAHRHAIVRRLPAVETLGSVTVICSDKTGTLTRNEMTVQRLITANAHYHVSGVGYAPEGEVTLDTLADKEPLQCSREGELPIDAMAAFEAGMLCNDTRMVHRDAAWQVVGDPTEAALTVAAQKAGLIHETLHSRCPRLDSIPFESQNRYMASYHCDQDGTDWILAKGAPERILIMCDSQLESGIDLPIDVDYWRRMSTDLAARGLRILALARKPGAPRNGLLSPADMEDGYVMLALVGIIDPPREEAISAVQLCKSAGITVKMITGDHADTAQAVGAQLGIGRGHPALTGAEISLMDDAELSRVVEAIDIFARASPEHKLRLVQALQQNGHVVAMTGDGVNDAPALKRADVGIAMGLKGTDAAREASAMLLTDDNFATIAMAVREGRAVYDNLRKFILFMLPTNGGEALVVIAALFLGLTLPLTPAQVLWINMVTASTLGVALAFDPPSTDIMHRPPRAPTEPIFTPYFIWRLVYVSLLMMVAAGSLFLYKLGQGAPLEVARSVAVNAIVLCEVMYLLNSRRIRQSVLDREGILGNPYALVTMAIAVALQALYIHWPPLQRIFGSASLDTGEWLLAIAVAVMLFFAVEAEKWLTDVMRGARRPETSSAERHATF